MNSSRPAEADAVLLMHHVPTHARNPVRKAADRLKRLKWARILLVLTPLVLAAVVAFSGSRGAFFANTDNPSNSLAAAAVFDPAAALTGTVTSAVTESDIVAGGKTLVITLTSDTWVATVGADNAVTTALISGIDSAQAEANGWNLVVKAGLTFNEVVRNSDKVVTITFPVFGSYNITADETITVTVPATAVASAGPIVAAPTFSVAAL